MTVVSAIEAGFAAALRDPKLPAPISLAGQQTRGLTRRFNVYRNNVYSGLIRVMEARYPAVLRIVGEDFFKGMARVFVDSTPPRSPVLLEYGEGFAEFLQSFGPTSDLPYLPDVARIEWRMHAARHAVDSAGMRASELAAFSDERIAEAGLSFASSVSLVLSDYPVFSIWRANAPGSASSGAQTFSGAESVLVTRPNLTAEAVRIPSSAAVFIAALRDGQSLGAAAEAAASLDPDFPLQRIIALLLSQKAIVSAHRILPHA